MSDKNVLFSSQRIKEETAGMWQDFYSELEPFSKVSGYFNDFHSWVSDAWSATEVGTSLQYIADLRNGVLRLTSGGSENDGTQLQLGGTGDSETTGESFAPAANKNLWFQTYIKSDDVTQHDLFFGLHVQDTAVIASLGADYIGFMTDDGDALLDVRSSASSVISTEAGVHTLVNDIYVKLGFKVTGTTKIEFYVNDVLKSTLTTVPTGLMRLTMAHLTGDGSANSVDIDYIACFQDR